MLSLIIPVYNEQGHLQEFLKMLLSIQFPCPVEYVIVDDCSTDNSWKILQDFSDAQRDPRLRLFRQPKNCGKGAAIHRGIELAQGDLIAIQYADFEYDPRDLVKLTGPLLENRADVVFGSRFHKSAFQVHRTFHYLVNRILTLCSNFFSGLYLTDMETCYKVFRAPILKNIHLESQRFGFEPEVTAAIARLKIRVEEYPISYFPRNYMEGKKITWRDGVAAFWFIAKYNMRALQRQIKPSMPTHFVPGGRQWL